MKKIITLILLVPTLALADQPLGFTDFSHYLQSKFSEFKNSPQVGYVRYGSPALSARIEEQNNQYQQQYAQTNGRFSYNQLAKFPAGNSRNFVENQMMNQIGTLAQTLAQNAGTALAFQSATQLRQQATELNSAAKSVENSTTGSPTQNQQDAQRLQTVAGQLNQEANAVEQGNQPQAQHFASQISSSQRAYVAPNYSPGPQESAFVMALNSVIQTIVMSSISVLSMGLANQLLAPLGLGNSGISGALGSGAVGVASGESVGNAASNVGVASVYTGGGAVNTTAQNKIQQSLSTNQPLPPVQVAPVQMNNSKINTSSASDSQAVPAGN